MTIKAILVPIAFEEDMVRLLTAAFAVAQPFDSLISSLCLHAKLPAMPDGAVMDVVHQTAARIETEHAARVKERFLSFMQERQIRVYQTPELIQILSENNGVPVGLSARWHDTPAHGLEAIASYGRLFDMIVLPRPSGSRRRDAQRLFETVLFECGRPVLLVPPKPVDSIGQTVVIAWNGSGETARTIASALPFLHRAKEAFVLEVEGALVENAASSEGIARHLRLHGIAVTVVRAETRKRTVGEAILEEAAKLGADLLIKGAYTQSWLRQVVFGGPTSDIIRLAAIPVLMVH